jgi:2-polyprenyl-3-methyl-5-hydroxy-6-metoxy-1,4-benzoquinol methylase
MAAACRMAGFRVTGTRQAAPASAQALPEERDELERPVYGPYAYARSLLTEGSQVLDVGCGNAKVSAYLAQAGAIVDGIEPAASRAGPARERVRYLSVLPAGSEDGGLLPAYDMITFFDVIEHLAEPEPVLAWAASRLKASGRIIASVPNSAHISFRAKMLRGDWSMRDWGLFDRTHLRFYDPATMLALRPPATRLIDRRFYEPHATGWRALRLRCWPALFALHVVLAWQRHGPEQGQP